MLVDRPLVRSSLVDIVYARVCAHVGMYACMHASMSVCTLRACMSLCLYHVFAINIRADKEAGAPWHAEVEL